MTAPSRRNAALRAVLGPRPAADEHLTTREFPAARRTSSEAREFVRTTLAAPHPTAGARPDADLRADAELVAYELVTNALRHALKISLDDPDLTASQPVDATIAVLLCRTGTRLTCGVLDPDAGAPHTTRPNIESTSGRGMAIIAGYSSRWGWLPVTDDPRYRKLVWAQFALPAPR